MKAKCHTKQKKRGVLKLLTGNVYTLSAPTSHLDHTHLIIIIIICVLSSSSSPMSCCYYLHTTSSMFCQTPVYRRHCSSILSYPFSLILSVFLVLSSFLHWAPFPSSHHISFLYFWYFLYCLVSDDNHQ